VGEQAAVIGPDVQPIVALVDSMKQPEKIAPDRFRPKLIGCLGRTLQEFFGQKRGALGESNEQDAI
jgi:hypothetical protein